jgi:hypothetical protein
VKQTPWRPKKDLPGRLSRDFRIYKLEKMFAGGVGNILQDSVKCMLHISETRNICKFCVVLLHKGSCFEKYHSVTNYLYAVSVAWGSAA